MHIYPQAQFQHLILVATKENFDAQDRFKFFKTLLFPSDLQTKQLWKLLFGTSSNTKNFHYPLMDSMFLMGYFHASDHLAPSLTFKDISHMHFQYALHKCSKCVTVFHDYSEKVSVKDRTQMNKPCGHTL